MMRSVLIDDSTSNENLVALVRRIVEFGAHLTSDSRLVMHGDVFVAIPGKLGDGRDFIAAAIERGASAVLLHVDDPQAWQSKEAEVPLFAVLNLKTRLGVLADLWYDRPSAKMTVIAVTGTNGKTTCTKSVLPMLRWRRLRSGWIRADSTVYGSILPATPICRVIISIITRRCRHTKRQRPDCFHGLD
jgi:UDP-N-acetylmuramyl tripeptide synthase